MADNSKLKTLKTLNSANFVKMIEMGVKNLKKHYQEVNDLNVFPVPDGDTGINMRRTIETGYDAIKDIKEGPLSEATQKMARGALLGARGNSGVILSQIFRGFSYGIANKKTVNVYGLHQAFKASVKQAYSAVNNPVEGTILTVLRESVKAAQKALTGTILQYLEALVKQAKITLDDTINMMDVLKEAGVIDSGGAGYYYIIQGFEYYFASKSLDEPNVSNISAYEEAIPHEKQTELDLSLFNEDSVLDYGYCTEFILQLQTSKVGNVSNFSEQEVIDYLTTQGDSIVCFKDGSIVKTHVHTKDPGAVLSYVRKWGEFLTVKIENMSLQHNNVIAKEKTKIEEKMPHKRVASVAVCQGEGLKQAFLEVGVDKIVDGNQTMNPSSEDFVKCFDKMDADNIIVLPNNSNIIMAAEQARDLYKVSNPNVNVVVIKTKSIAQGFIAANMFVFDALSIEEIESSIYESIEGVTSIEITTATRNTTVSGVKVTKGHYIGIMNHSLVEDEKDKINCLINSISHDDLKYKENILLVYGKDATEDDKSKAKELVGNTFKSLEISEIEGGQDVYDFIVAIF
ncbi:MAG: DAK2 domain-containing protein [Gammaproteobacteria bacterium]|nr:DAK2 domain-containing protein [Gammaproteobacteria bacterium]